MNRTINLLAVISCLVAGTNQVWATASVTKLANASLSADTTGATYTTLSGPALTEGAAGDIGTGTIVLNPPRGFVFDTTAIVTATVSGAGGSGITLLLTSGVAVVTPNTITINVVGRDVGSKRSKITWSGIRARPTSGTPLAKGTLTDSGTAVLVGLSGTSSFGTLTEIAGRATHLAFTRQPGTATAGSAFGVQPIVSSQDQFGNISTSGLPSTSYITAALSSGSGLLQGPSFVLSTALATAGKRYPFISLPPSSWFVRPDISESIDGGVSQVQGTIREMIDFYYGLGALINGYSHSSAASTSIGDGSMQNVQDYITYSMAKPRIWSANAAGVYSWWIKRATAKITPTFALNGTQSQTSVSLSGASDPQTAIDFYLPHPAVSDLQILTNGVVASGSSYRINA